MQKKIQTIVSNLRMSKPKDVQTAGPEQEAEQVNRRCNDVKKQINWQRDGGARTLNTPGT